jgi:hypothetical protein
MFVSDQEDAAEQVLRIVPPVVDKLLKADGGRDPSRWFERKTLPKS